LDRGIAGTLTAPSSYFMKSPPLQYTDDEARQLTEAFIAGSVTPRIKPRKAVKGDVPKVAVMLSKRLPRKEMASRAGERVVPPKKWATPHSGRIEEKLTPAAQSLSRVSGKRRIVCPHGQATLGR
jgi:hypothetical protein